ncbi:helix-turn-helix domain-containing protein [Halomonas sp. hl-4]|uniref:helix-turn-helix domain-containing protein n=1 Tax=Halomonas sp. hl-4 TaxID=1761789 RepID=UPI000BB7E914|nr:response regulator transcription factor [Halomonas sp. hl-4]SNY96781.1 regulatory protein, luxR family [Halomonas sp. hl-4]
MVMNQESGADYGLNSMVDPSQLQSSGALDSADPTPSVKVPRYAHALSPTEILKQIAMVVMNQGIWVPPDVMAQVMGSTWRLLNGDQQLQSSVLEALTQREREVALAVAKGASNKVVARELDITERTVKAHLTAIFSKLDIHDRLQLIIKLTGKGTSAGVSDIPSFSTSK